MVELLIRRPVPTITAESLLREINKARMSPATYVPVIEKYRSQYTKPNDPGAVDEAIAVLLAHRPCTTAIRLNSAASAIVDPLLEEQARTGATGHGSFSSRISQAGNFRSIAENIAYGIPTAEQVVAAWIIDAGVPSRGHRINLLNCIYTDMGYGDATHRVYGNSVAIVLFR